MVINVFHNLCKISLIIKYKHVRTNTNRTMLPTVTDSEPCPSTSWGNPRDTPELTPAQDITQHKREDAVTGISKTDGMVIILTTTMPDIETS